MEADDGDRPHDGGGDRPHQELDSPSGGFVAMIKKPSHLRGAVITLVICVVWVVLARRSPELHYHFVPLLAAAAWPLSLRSQGQRSVRDAVEGATGAVAITLVTTLVIQLAGYMNGPNFLHEGPAWPEAALFAFLGAIIGVRTTSRTRPGMLGSLIDTTV